MMNRDFVVAAVAKACARYIFETFDGNLGNLKDLYHEDASMTFRGEFYQGKAAISDKFDSLGLQQSQHSIDSVDGQPDGDGDGDGGGDGAIIMQVLGHWKFTDSGGNQQIRKFSEITRFIDELLEEAISAISAWDLTVLDFIVWGVIWAVFLIVSLFKLLPTPEGGYCIKNDMFRLIDPIPAQNDYMEE